MRFRVVLIAALVFFGRRAPLAIRVMVRQGRRQGAGQMHCHRAGARRRVRRRQVNVVLNFVLCDCRSARRRHWIRSGDDMVHDN